MSSPEPYQDCATCSEREGCSDAGDSFTCATCQKDVPVCQGHADDLPVCQGHADDLPDDCTDCWAEREEARLFCSALVALAGKGYAFEHIRAAWVAMGLPMAGGEAMSWDQVLENAGKLIEGGTS